MQPTCQDGLITRDEYPKQEVRVMDDVYALKVGQDLSGLAELSEDAQAAAGHAPQLRPVQD